MTVTTIVTTSLTIIGVLFALWALPRPRRERSPFSRFEMRTQRGRWTRWTIGAVLVAGCLVYGRFALSALLWVQVAFLVIIALTALRVYRNPAYWASKHMTRSGDYDYIRM